MEKKISKEDILERLGSEASSQSFWRRHWAKFVVVFLIVVWSYFYSTIQESKVDERYNTTTLSKQDLVIKVSATGNIEPTNRVDVGIEVSGTIEEVLVDYNDKVKKNQTLAKLDTTKLLSQFNNSKASLAVAKANLQEANISISDTYHELQRMQRLYRSTRGNYPAQQRIDQAQIAYLKAQAIYGAYKAKVLQAKALLKANEDDLKKAVVVSPIDGIVLDRKIEVGQSVVANMQIPILFTLAQDLKKMQAIISVDEADIGKIKEKQSVEFSVDAYPKKIFDGLIRQIRLNGVKVDGVVTYEVVVDVNNSNLLLRPGMTVSADIITQKLSNQPTIPNSALRFSPTSNKANKNKGMFASKPKKTKKKKSSEKSIWILQEGKPSKVVVEIGVSDGIFSVLKSKNIESNTPIIISMKAKSDE
ncbi:MAG: efflux RND transporter periplasmic adaptor subunit [Campylobacterota bacterium]|nr:efflux RND transporter periplasmic adaptor subunit [Campylobacterota bacterium]